MQCEHFYSVGDGGLVLFYHVIDPSYFYRTVRRYPEKTGPIINQRQRLTEPSRVVPLGYGSESRPILWFQKSTHTLGFHR